MTYNAMTGQRPTDAMLDRLDSIASRSGRQERWLPSRLILHNYWLYEYQEFHFADGKLVLRGQNGAGKSTVLTTAVTLALDGDKSPVRMDTFGTITKSISDYLVGPRDAEEGSPLFSKDRTAFIALEFRNGTTGAYKTVGLSVRAERVASGGTPKLSSWYFVVGDGRRCGKDMDVEFSRMDGGAELMRTYREMDETLTGPGNYCGTDRSEYQHEVNRELFGFSTDDAFRYLMQVLLTLRSPKLGKGLKPEAACEMLAEALPPLDPALLDKVTRLLDDIDATQRSVQQTATQLRLVKGVDRAQASLARAYAQLTAVDYREAVQSVRDLDDQVTSRKAQVAESRTDVKKASADLDALAKESDELRGKLKILRNHELYKSQDKLRGADAARAEAEEASKRAKNAVTVQSTTVRELDDSVEATARRWRDRRERLLEETFDIRPLVDEARWAVAESELERLIELLKALTVGDAPPSVREAQLRSDAEERLAELRALKQALDEVAKAERADERAAQRVDDAEEEVNRAKVQEGQAADAVAVARQSSVDRLQAWQESLTEIPATRGAVAMVAEKISGYSEPSLPVAGLLRPVLDPVDRHRAALTADRDRARDRVSRLQGRRSEAQAALDEWKEGEHRNVPEPRAGQEALRDALAEEGIPAIPLYAGCDFRDSVSPAEAARIEAALSEAGLLDALIVESHDQERVRALAAALPADRADRWIAIAPVEGPTLMDVIEPADSPIQSATIRAALKSIRRDGQGPTTIDLDGRWALGALHGAALFREQASFIGETNRRRAWELRLRELKQVLDDVEAELIPAQDRVSELDDRLSTLAAEVERLRDAEEFRVLQAALHQLRIREDHSAASEARHEKAIADAEAAREALNDARTAVRTATEPLPEAQGLDAEGVLELIRATSEALRAIRKLASTIDELSYLTRLNRKNREQLGRAETDLREAQEHAGEMLRRYRRRASEYEAIKANLEERGLDEILELERKAEQRLEDGIPQEEKALLERKGKLEERIQRALADIDKLQQEVADEEARTGEARRLFLDSLNAYPTLASDLERFHTTSPEDAADDLLKDRRDDSPESLRDRVDRSVNEAETRLVKALYEEDTDKQLDTFRPTLDNERAPFTMVIFRAVPTATGALTPYAFQEVLDAEHQTHQQLVDEREEELYEAFLYGEVAAAVRTAIQDATKATEHINELLAATPLSDNKQIRLRWGPRSEPVEKGGKVVDFGPHIERLKLSPEALRPDQLGSVKTFFSDRIAEVRQQEREGANPESFSEALHRVLDYRSWFRYQIVLKEGSQAPRVLNERKHGTMSGAEKALSVFMPLLAAADARYRDASPDSPKLLAMDEAFSGVDPENTAAVLSFMEGLDFSWLISSEKLWGAGASLAACTTYQFHKKDDVAAVTLYLWDGKERIHEAALGRRPEPEEPPASVEEGAA